MSGYQPVACDFYDIFEIAILRGQRLRLHIRDTDGTEREAIMTPKDLRIHDGAEVLVALGENGEPMELRLDRIESAIPIPAA